MSYWILFCSYSHCIIRGNEPKVYISKTTQHVCNRHILWFTSHITELTISYSPGQFMVVYMISMESLTIKTYVGVAITYSVLSCLVQELWRKIHYLVMVDIKMAAMATRGRFCDGSISDNVQGPKLYKCTQFHTFMKKWKMLGQKHWTTSQHHQIDHNYSTEQFMMLYMISMESLTIKT